MSYSVINEELRIQACSIADLSAEQFAEPLEDPESITVIYDQVTDMVILNQENNDYELYKLLADTYLSVDKKTRLSLKWQAKEITKHGFDGTFNLLDAIVRRRKQIEADKQAKELKQIIGKQYSDPYHDNYNIIKAMRKIDACDGYFQDYDVFMYGYIQGIRAERARRKKVAL